MARQSRFVTTLRAEMPTPAVLSQTSDLLNHATSTRSGRTSPNRRRFVGPAGDPSPMSPAMTSHVTGNATFAILICPR